MADQGQVAAAVDPDDADDLRGFHFRRLLGHTLTRISAVVLVLGGGVAGAIAAGPAIGAAIAFGVLLLIVVVVFFIADAAAEDAFFEAYSEKRGFELVESGSLPGATPLLRKGDERKAEQIMSGALADGLDGTLALYTYTDVSHDKDGRHETDYHFTVAMAQIPKCAPFVGELICQRKFGFRVFEKVEDVFRSNERVKLESVALDERFEIFADEAQDAAWLRQLFSPSFIVWLSDSAPEKFAFELVDGTLCCNVKGHKKSATELDTMREATAAVARRIREEAHE